MHSGMHLILQKALAIFFHY